MNKIALVVPTIRENCMKDFIKRWDDIGLFDTVDLLVMEDNPTKTFSNNKITYHASWEDIENNLKEDSWIIPRRSDTVRSFMYLKAWELDYEYIMTLDDDCYPATREDGLTYDGVGFVNEHLKNLNGKTKWFNTLNSVKPRGIPFYNTGKNDRVVLNHGLWTNVLDYDAPTQLAAPTKETFSFDNKIIPAGLYFPMCGMNLMWKSEITVLMYHLLMGQQVMPGGKLQKLSFDRFGDIFCGILLKKILDLKRLNVSTGMPYIRHERASNPFANLKKEANGIEVNEKFWDYIDIWNSDNNKSLSCLYEEIGMHVRMFDCFTEHNEYFKKLGEAMIVWANLFKK